MAGRTRKTQEAAPSGPVLVLTESQGVKRAPGRGAAPIPQEIYQGLDWSLSNGSPGAFPGQPSEEAAKAVVNLLRRAQGEANRGEVEHEHFSLSTSVTEQADGTWTVDFQAKHGTRNRSYNADAIREWAKEVGYDPEFYAKKVHADVRKAYRVAHGYEREEKK